LLRALGEANVEYILVGGVAAAAHGSARATQDLDIVYRRSPENLKRLTLALGPLQPYLRGAPPGLPFRFDVETIRHGLNFTLETSLGWIDLLGEIAGGGKFEDLVSHAIGVQAFGVECMILDLPTLIQTKRAAGRRKDLEAVAELEIIRDRTAGK
jgi:hypothetical protein